MTQAPYNYFTTEYAIKEHNFIISESGGMKGVRNIGLIDSVLHHIENEDYYEDFLDKVTHIVFGLNKNHAFNDGNKRASIALSSFFLELNNENFPIKQYTSGMEEVAVWVAKSMIEKETLKKIITFLLYDNPVNVNYFIKKAKTYRQFIEPQNAPIKPKLLVEMIEHWIGEKDISESGKVELFNAIN